MADPDLRSVPVFAAHAAGRVGRTRSQRYPGNGSDAGQRLSAKSQRRHSFEIIHRGQFAGGVVEEGEINFRRGDAPSIVGDANLCDSALPNQHSDTGCTGVQGVFDQLLYHRSGPLYNLPGGDLGRHVGRKLLYGHGVGGIRSR